MSSSSSSIVEHIVLFRFKKEAEDEKVRTCITKMNGLKSIESVLHLTVGSIHNITSSSSSSHFTHILHSRYSSKSDLMAYANHPIHLSLVEDTLLPICEEIMAVDWINKDEGGREKVELLPGWGVKLVLMKPRKRLEEEEKRRLMRAAAVDSAGNGVVMLSGGENFSPARGKGFSLASMAVFTGAMEVGKNEVEEEMVKGGVGELLESFIVVHYVLPRL